MNRSLMTAGVLALTIGFCFTGTASAATCPELAATKAGLTKIVGAMLENKMPPAQAFELATAELVKLDLNDADKAEVAKEKAALGASPTQEQVLAAFKKAEERMMKSANEKKCSA